MKVKVYSGYGSLRELRWEGKLDILPEEGEAIALPEVDEGYRVERRVWRLDQKPYIEISVK